MLGLHFSPACVLRSVCSLHITLSLHFTPGPQSAVCVLHWPFPEMDSSRRMPGHIREFNRLEPHSSHDLVFKIWRNNKTEVTFGVFCLWLWVTRNQISMGTTGIFISRNIKFKILPSINASLSDFTGFFALKTNQKIAIFAWIFTCVDFRGKITTKVCRNRERYHLISWHLWSAFKTTTVF